VILEEDIAVNLYLQDSGVECSVSTEKENSLQASSSSITWLEEIQLFICLVMDIYWGNTEVTSLGMGSAGVTSTFYHA